MKGNYLRPDGHQRIGPFWLAWGRTRQQRWIADTQHGTWKLHAIIFKDPLGGPRWSPGWACSIAIHHIATPECQQTIHATGPTRRRAISNGMLKLHSVLS